MNNGIIFKDYFSSGTSINSFKDEVRKIVSHTAYIKTYPANMRFLSFREKKDVLLKNGKDIKRSYLFRLLDRESLEAQSRFNTVFPEVPITTTLVDGKPNSNSMFLDQIVKSTGLIVELLDKDGECYYYGLSDYALPMLAKRAGLKGDRIKENSFFRDIYLASGVINPNTGGLKTDTERNRVDKILSEGFSLILRKTKPQEEWAIRAPIGTGIILSVFSSNFCERDASVFLDIVDSLGSSGCFGKPDVEMWTSAQDYLTLRLTFGELTDRLVKKYGIKKDVKAQIEIQDSDCGLSSLTVRGLVRFGNDSSLVIGSGLVQEKNGIEFDVSRIVEKVESEVLPRIEDVFKNIARLDSQELPSKYKGSYVRSIAKKAIKSMPSIDKTLGKKRIKLLNEIVVRSKMTDIGTVYDVVDKVLSFPSYVNEVDELEPLGKTAYDMWVKENVMPMTCNYIDF